MFTYWQEPTYLIGEIPVDFWWVERSYLFTQWDTKFLFRKSRGRLHCFFVLFLQTKCLFFNQYYCTFIIIWLWHILESMLCSKVSLCFASCPFKNCPPLILQLVNLCNQPSISSQITLLHIVLIRWYHMHFFYRTLRFSLFSAYSW